MIRNANRTRERDLPDAYPNHYTTEATPFVVQVPYLSQVNKKKALDCKYTRMSALC